MYHDYFTPLRHCCLQGTSDDTETLIFVCLQVLRCRCKHKHVDHDPNTRVCKKPKCSCQCFDSPWVCNCDHGWGEHDHVLVEKDIPDLSSLGLDVPQASIEAGIAPEVNNYAALKRGAGYNDSVVP
ncbi:MAG: FAM221A/B family protein [Akkermansiaceae bacterium]|nr:FAM221A/B family protein [Akkermansiaceae bacterium]